MANPAAPGQDDDPSATPPHILGFNAFKKHRLGGSRLVTDRHGTRYLGGGITGEPMEVDSRLQEEYASLSDEEKRRYESQANGDHLKTTQSEAPAAGQLPANFNAGFNDFSPGSNFTHTGGSGSRSLVSGSSPSDPDRLMNMMRQQAHRANAAREAVQAGIAEQRANPAATVARATAVRDAELAKDGITDMGGGNRMLRNRYGTGFATKLTPEEHKDRKPGVIIDEKGEVDTARMMSNAGKGTTTPHIPGTEGAGLNKEVSAQIEAGIAGAAPFAAERRAADLKRETEAYAAENPPLTPATSTPNATTTPSQPASVKETAAKAAPAVAPLAVAATVGRLPFVGPALTGIANTALHRSGFNLAPLGKPSGTRQTAEGSPKGSAGGLNQTRLAPLGQTLTRLATPQPPKAAPSR
jgi:hypothetical protein